LISKTLTLPLVVLPPAGGFSVVAVPPTVLASPGQAVAVRYEFRNLGDEPLVITGDTFVRRDRNGVVFDSQMLLKDVRDMVAKAKKETHTATSAGK
jgi:hypothetical protein